MSDETFMGVPRNKIDWYPTIDYDKCNGCLDCIKFCPHKVFEVNETAEHKITVKNPTNCVVFCRACSKACGLDAIEFQNKNETTAHIKAVRKEETSNE